MKKAMQLNSGKEALCEQHQEKLLLFCKEDEKLLCVRCEHSSEHKGHTTLLLEEAAKQQKVGNLAGSPHSLRRMHFPPNIAGKELFLQGLS